MGIQTGVDGERWERLNDKLLHSFRALGTWMCAVTALVAADVLKLAVDATAEATVEIMADEVRRRG